MSKGRSIALWLVSFFLTLATAVYQRLTGPTHPLRGSESLLETQVRYRLERSGTAHLPLPVAVAVDAPDCRATLAFRRFPGDEPWTVKRMTPLNGGFSASLPGQPRAGKLEFMVHLERGGRRAPIRQGRAVVVRFKGEVPVAVLITHVVFMFSGMLLAIRTGMEALHSRGNPYRLAFWTLLVVAVGGLILGPVVQKYAFGHLWTGFPLGSDLTDNKTLLAVLCWIGGLLLGRRSRWWIVAAAVLMISVYLIPHSVRGSQLDYRTGQVVTGR